MNSGAQWQCPTFVNQGVPCHSCQGKSSPLWVSWATIIVLFTARKQRATSEASVKCWCHLVLKFENHENKCRYTPRYKNGHLHLALVYTSPPLFCCICVLARISFKNSNIKSRIHRTLSSWKEKPVAGRKGCIPWGHSQSTGVLVKGPYCLRKSPSTQACLFPLNLQPVPPTGIFGWFVLIYCVF